MFTKRMINYMHPSSAVSVHMICMLVRRLTLILLLPDSASLSIYYLITIRSGRFKSQQKLHKVEPWLHIIPVAFGLGTAIASLALNLFNYGLWDCWIAPYPQGCKESWRNNGSTTCMRGDNASLYIWLFDLIPKWSSILIVTINMVLVYIFVRNQEIISERWSSRRAVGSSVVNNSANGGGSNEEISSGEQSQENNTGRISLRRSSRRRRDSQARRRLNFSRQIAHQSYLYVGALWITWLPVIVLRGVQLASGVTYYWLLVWVALSIPMHGFWNLLVYLRPRWLQKRKEHLEKYRGNLTPADERDEAEETVSGRVSVGTAASRAATFLKTLSVAAYDTVTMGDIPEAEVYEMSDSSNHNQVSGSDDFLEEGEMKRESVVRFAQDQKDEDDYFEEDNNDDDKETG